MASTTPLRLTHVQGNVYVLTGGPANVTVQVGREGLLFVDAPSAARVPEAMEVIRKVADLPVAYVIGTHLDAEHLDGRDALAAFAAPAPGTRSRTPGAPLPPGADSQRLKALAHEKVLERMSSQAAISVDPASPVNAEYYWLASKDFFMNGEPIVVYHLPEAHTDGDSIVHFRRSDVISTGDLFTPGRYPLIETENGGGVEGLIAALNRILELTVPGPFQEGGTYVVPGHGRVCDEADVVEYRDMVMIVRDRVKHLLERGMTLEQIQATRPTLDYDTEYGGRRGGPSGAEFVAALYRGLVSPTGAKP